MQSNSLSEVLKYHEMPETPGLTNADILGDAYLISKNPIYRKVKERALELGCVYKEAWAQYLNTPFLELGKIVSTKTLPYNPGGKILREVEAKRPGVFTIEEIELPESHHLHEAAHVIADDLFSGFSPANDQEKILRSMMCESFANTVDLLACLPANDDVHKYFLAHNSYMHPQDDELVVLERLNKAVNPKCFFMLAFHAYLYSNFLIETFVSQTSEKILRKYAPEVEITEDLLTDCEALAAIAENLDPQFRTITTEIYFKMEGFDESVYELLNFSFMKVLEQSGELQKVVNDMAAVFAER